MACRLPMSPDFRFQVCHLTLNQQNKVKTTTATPLQLASQPWPGSRTDHPTARLDLRFREDLQLNSTTHLRKPGCPLHKESTLGHLRCLFLAQYVFKTPTILRWFLSLSNNMHDCFSLNRIAGSSSNVTGSSYMDRAHKCWGTQVLLQHHLTQKLMGKARGINVTRRGTLTLNKYTLLPSNLSRVSFACVSY